VNELDAGIASARPRPDDLLFGTMLIPAQAAHHNEMMSPAVTE
jgi:hypothetical protein